MNKILTTDANRLKTKLSIRVYIQIFLNLLKTIIQSFKTNRIEVLAYFTLVVGAGIMRFWDLGSRALHHDESLHAYFSWQLSIGNGYVHNPMMHGPLQFELNAVLFYIFGVTDVTARSLYAVFGVLLVVCPLLLRDKLGRAGCFIAALLLAFSPALLYFSRFARNDILIAVWTFALIAFLWRYLDSGKNRYLFGTAFALALSFSSKESTYFTVAILSIYLGFILIRRNLHLIYRQNNLYGIPIIQVILILVNSLYTNLKRSISLRNSSRETVFLIVLWSISLPLWSGFISIFQIAGSNLVLASEIGPNIGSPSGGGLLIAGILIGICFLAGCIIGLRWNWKAWIICALIFYVPWILFHTTFLNNMNGVGSGLWQSLGYWVVQQGESRGNQPAYYYLLIVMLYEFLPLSVSLTSVIYYFKKKEPFAKFLIFWSIATLLIYTIASEKMPWLLVHIALPMIILSGKVLGDYFKNETVSKFINVKNCSLALLTLAFLFFAWRLAFWGVDGNPDNLWILFLLIIGLVLVMLGVGLFLRFDLHKTSIKVIGLSVILILFGLTVRSGVIATYKNGDIPVEMLVYTQTSPDVPSLAKHIATIEEKNESKPTVDVDSTSGFQWPWAWYLRDVALAGYPQYGQHSPSSMMEQEVLIIHSQNKLTVQEPLKEKYGEGIRFKHRWWFPEHTYRDLSLKKILQSIFDRHSWVRSMDYFIYRDLNHNLSSEDAYVYFDDSEMRKFSSLELE
ncbi:MAG: TIGR03663 family protein [SAR202 cluster bacterium]|nr:TIGR03663 family protein [SAR202 cluster bacterium]